MPYDKRMQVIQNRLHLAGYKLDCDGYWGDETYRTLMLALDENDVGVIDPVVGMEEQTYKVVVPALWMPEANMKRVIWHWTAGGYEASSLDKEHYHMLVDGKDTVIKGEHSIKANEKIVGEYAAHTKDCNTGSIGLSVCAMVGAIETPYNAGKCPMKESQIHVLAQITAQLCKRYKIPVSRTTTLSHAEVQPTLGIKQRGKWDYSRLPHKPDLVGPLAVGDEIRRLVTAYM